MICHAIPHPQTRRSPQNNGRQYSPSPLDSWLAAICGTDEVSSEAVAALQWKRLKETVEYARLHSLFYQNLLAGFAVQSRADFDKLPFTRAADLINWQDFLCVSRGDVERMVTLQSSGSTAEPKRLAFTDWDIDRTKEFFRVGMSTLVRSGDSCLILLPGAERPQGVSRILADTLEQGGVQVRTGEPQVTLDSLCADFACLCAGREQGENGKKVWTGEERDKEAGRITVVAAPSQLAVLLKTNLPVAGILSSAEPLPADLTRALEQKFNCPVLDHYGMTESGYGGGVECWAHAGYHLRELDVFFELIEIDGDSPVPVGEEGEIVITTLTREAMPLIRYRTGDVSRLLAGPCPCGSPLRRLAPVRGRITRSDGKLLIRPVQKGYYYERLAPDSL